MILFYAKPWLAAAEADPVRAVQVEHVRLTLVLKGTWLFNQVEK